MPSGDARTPVWQSNNPVYTWKGPKSFTRSKCIALCTSEQYTSGKEMTEAPSLSGGHMWTSSRSARSGD